MFSKWQKKKKKPGLIIHEVIHYNQVKAVQLQMNIIIFFSIQYIMFYRSANG